MDSIAARCRSKESKVSNTLCRHEDSMAASWVPRQQFRGSSYRSSGAVESRGPDDGGCFLLRTRCRASKSKPQASSCSSVSPCARRASAETPGGGPGSVSCVDTVAPWLYAGTLAGGAEMIGPRNSWLEAAGTRNCWLAAVGTRNCWLEAVGIRNCWLEAVGRWNR